MVSVEHARSLVLKGVKPLPTSTPKVLPDSTLDEALHARPALATSLHAKWSLPGHDTSIMDGFAVRCTDLKANLSFAIEGESAAGHPSSEELASRHAMRISTGAVLPVGADMVVPIEECTVGGDRLQCAVQAQADAQVGRFVRPAGSDIAAGKLLLEAGTSLGPGELALLVAGGHHEIPIHRAPTVAIVATGDELLAPGSVPARGQLIETNAMMLAALCRELGARVVSIAKAGDNPEDTRAKLAAAMSADLLLTSGGISVGQHDLVAPALTSLGFVTAFRKVRLRPGKPTTFGHLGTCRVLALPGNPASTYVAFELFARPLLRKLAGYHKLERTRQRLKLASPMRADETRDHYARARLIAGRAQPLPTQLSGALTSLAAADLLIILPAGSGDHAVGSEVDVLMLKGHE